MEKHLLLTDDQFEMQLESTTIDPELFSHEAHIRLAWIHIRKYGLEQAIENVQQQIKQFADSQGAFDKFNKTLTVAAVRAVYHFMLKSRSDTFRGFIEEFPQLKTHFKDLMACHYGFDIYQSQLAKTEYLEPDLIPFD